MDRKFVLSALVYAILGLFLGVYMAAVNDHSQMTTHAHILLMGFVLSFAYGLCHKLWLDNLSSGLAVIQFYIHQAGVLVLLIGLFLIYGSLVKETILAPVMGVASIAVLLAAVLMGLLLLKHPTQG